MISEASFLTILDTELVSHSNWTFTCSYVLASNQALPLRAQLFKRGKMKEGESLEDLDHVLDMDDVFWTWFSISGRYRPRTATANANYDTAVFLWSV